MSAPLHIVGLSGGKDSTAMALWLHENAKAAVEVLAGFVHYKKAR